MTLREKFYSLLLLLVLFSFLACGPGNPPSIKNEPGNMNNNKSGPVRYVALGDSTGVGVGARNGGYVIRLFQKIERVRPSSHLTNLCVSGATSADVLSEQLEPGIKARPTLVTIGIGINDVAIGVSEEAYARNLEVIITRLKTETSASIVITNLPDVSLAPIVPPERRDQLHNRLISFNQKIKELTDRHGLLVVDAFATHEMIPTRSEFFSADKFHPSDIGYQYWADLMWPTVQKAIGE
jgi:lysophospholipase L1-like esterase